MTAHRVEVGMKDGTRIALLEQTISHINDTLIRIEKRFDAIDGRFDRLESELKQGFKDINNRMWTNFFWTIAGFASTLAVVAHAVHWY